jgi:hypothetical protein
MLARFTEKRGMVAVFVLLDNGEFVRYREQLWRVCVWYWKRRGRFVEILPVSVFVRACVHLAECPNEGEVICVIILMACGGCVGRVPRIRTLRTRWK